jgi:hypothetical protein
LPPAGPDPAWLQWNNPRAINKYLYDIGEAYISGHRVTTGVFMAEESSEISSMTVIGIGVVLFVVIVGIWYLFLR